MSAVAAKAVPYDPLSYLRANAAVRGDALALHDEGEELSFDALLRAVLSLAADLRERGVEPGDVVAVALPNVWRYVALEIAVPAVGGVLLPLPIGLGRLDAESAIERSGASLVIGESDAGELETDGDPGDIPFAEPDPDRVVQIALTSGTTGRSKLAGLTARLKQLTFEGFTSRLGLGPRDRMLPLSPITQGAGEMCLYALRTGAALVMAHHARFDAERSLALAERTRTTVLGGVPTMVARLLHSPALADTDLSHLRATISAGAPLPEPVAREWEQRTGSPTCSFYGAMDVGQLAVPSPDDPAEKRWTTVGRPHDRAEVLICNPDGSAVEPGEEGEICMRGPLVQPQYWREDETPYADDGWAHFGDLGRLDEDGYLHVTGRVKDTIIRGGSNINPFEVEDVLRGSAAVQDVCVVGRPDEDLGERAVAFVVPAPGSTPSLDDLTAHLERGRAHPLQVAGGRAPARRAAARRHRQGRPPGAPRTGKGGRMTAARYEVGRGEPVVLVHGLADDHRAWRRVVAPLMLTRRVVLYDLRGHGGSPLGDDADGSLAQLGADLIERARRRRDRPRGDRRLLARRHDRHARRHRRAGPRRRAGARRHVEPRQLAPRAGGTRSAPRWSRTTIPSSARRSTRTPRTSTATAPRRSRPGCGSAASRRPTRAASPTPASPWRASTRRRSTPSWAPSPCRP